MTISRRKFLGTVGGVAGGVALSGSASALDQVGEKTATHAAAATVPLQLTVNGQRHSFSLDPRVTLLDLLRENLNLTGTKKGCDHGQCGACTVLANGRRINSCLSLAVVHQDEQITTVEGLARG